MIEMGKVLAPCAPALLTGSITTTMKPLATLATATLANTKEEFPQHGEFSAAMTR